MFRNANSSIVKDFKLLKLSKNDIFFHELQARKV